MQEFDNIPNIDDDDQQQNEIFEASMNQQTKAEIEGRKTEHWEMENQTFSNQNDDNDNLPDEQEEKARLISQVLELQNTLDGEYFYCYFTNQDCLPKNIFHQF